MNASTTRHVADPEELDDFRWCADEITLPQDDNRSVATDCECTGWLSVVFGPDRGAPAGPIQLQESDTFLVGRGVKRSGLALLDQRLSRLHFRIVWDGRCASFRIADARSTNGTFVNGARRLSGPLRHGDVIRAGDTLFVFETSQPMTRLRERVERVAHTERNVVLLGETGSGKEVLARLLHDRSGRRGPFVAVNCAAIPRELVGPELFGHTRGAFSGAVRARTGLFLAADEGTLLLDEVADLPLDAQPALLRTLQERVVRPVGSDTEIPLRVRVVAATHVDLGAARGAGRFRDDLFARLSQLVFHVPPLRERRTEVLSLARGFCPEPLALSASAAEALLLWHWPRNVRELRSLVETFVAVEPPGTPLDLAYLTTSEPSMVERFRNARAEAEPGASVTGPAVTRTELESLLDRHRGNVSAIAGELGKARAQVYRWIDSYGLSTKRCTSSVGNSAPR